MRAHFLANPGGGEVSRKKEPWEAGHDLLHTRTYILGKQSLPSQPLHGNPYTVLLEVSSLCHPNPPTHVFLNLSTKFAKWKVIGTHVGWEGEGHSLTEARVLKPGPLGTLSPHVKDVEVLF